MVCATRRSPESYTLVWTVTVVRQAQERHQRARAADITGDYRRIRRVPGAVK